MPELPEAETIVRGLRPRLTGRTVTGLDVVRPDILREEARAFRRGLIGRTVSTVERRAKNVVFPLVGGGVLAVNLGMTGRLLLDPPSSAARHPAVRFALDDGHTLVFDDVRRFGTVECLDAEAWRARSDAMGPEPLDPGFRAEELRRRLAESRAPVRSWLLDQRKIAGVGNIYANEALYLAGIDPRRPARDVTSAEAGRLHGAIREVLEQAIRAGGTTLRDYRTADGDEGRYGNALRVYGRAGEPCARCGTGIVRIVFANRSAFLCPRCQPPKRRRTGKRAARR